MAYSTKVNMMNDFIFNKANSDNYLNMEACRSKCMFLCMARSMQGLSIM